MQAAHLVTFECPRTRLAFITNVTLPLAEASISKASIPLIFQTSIDLSTEEIPEDLEQSPVCISILIISYVFEANHHSSYLQTNTMRFSILLLALATAVIGAPLANLNERDAGAVAEPFDEITVAAINK
ncbi:hypothetical protein BO94DRAFT_624108 [Aspergillus sclerotioniger CBS 115572]|uniref:Uncharacterized protein n=1 Tax=Aspergillus sclerotioniger CBS 115572 TaxID=1450535 RepID=A0A317WSS9_9EURO|nr:hypothetical protein BO94DRAFT_624108 [Aspergillus sclerotioniger CBS 115572]PWY87968.1 hypothetical protein BO94DRAFT_624108 [Aspergillus sclerotioniger CBS 115572]